MDYSGNWKMSHNMVGSTFNEVLMTSYFEVLNTTSHITERLFHVFIVNDGLAEIENAEIFIQQFRYDQTTSDPVNQVMFKKNIPAASS